MCTVLVTKKVHVILTVYCAGDIKVSVTIILLFCVYCAGDKEGSCYSTV